MTSKKEIIDKIGKKISFDEKDTLIAKLDYISGLDYFDSILQGKSSKENNAIIHSIKYSQGILFKIAKGFGGIKTYYYPISNNEIKDIKFEKRSQEIFALILQISDYKDLEFLILKKDLVEVGAFFKNYLKKYNKTNMISDLQKSEYYNKFKESIIEGLLIKTSIKDEQINKFGKREGMKLVKIFAIFGTLFILANLIMLPISEPTFKINLMNILYLIIMAIISFAILFGALFILHKWATFLKIDFGKNKQLELSDISIISTVNYENLNLLNKFSYMIIVKLYGINFNQKAYFKDIKMTKIKKNDIKIYSSNNLNNPIIIPVEIENYSEILNVITNNSPIFKIK